MAWRKVGMRENGEAMGSLTREEEKRRRVVWRVVGQSEGGEVERPVRARWIRSCARSRSEIAKNCESRK